MKTSMLQINQAQANNFADLANQSLSLEEMNHLFGGDGDNGGSSEIVPSPPIYIKEE
jgi:hypothetical protein